MSKKNAKRERYTDEFKAEALRLVEQRVSRTNGDLAASIGISEDLLHSWKRRLDPSHENDRGETPEQGCAGCVASTLSWIGIETPW